VCEINFVHVLTIIDFDYGTDSIMLTGGLSVTDVTSGSRQGNALIKIKGGYSAILRGIDPTEINAEDFIVTYHDSLF